MKRRIFIFSAALFVAVLFIGLASVKAQNSDPAQSRLEHRTKCAVLTEVIASGDGFVQRGFSAVIARTLLNMNLLTGNVGMLPHTAQREYQIVRTALVSENYGEATQQTVWMQCGVRASNTCRVCPSGSTCQRDHMCTAGGSCQWGFRCIKDVVAVAAKGIGEVCETSNECSGSLSCRPALVSAGEGKRICVQLLPTLSIAARPNCFCSTDFEPACTVSGKVFGNACLATCAGAELKNEGRCAQSLAVDSRLEAE